MTGTVTLEAFTSNAPLAAPADSVVLSFAFDQDVVSDAGGTMPGALIADYDAAALSATVEVLDAAGDVLISFVASDPFLQITNRASDESPDQLRLRSGDGGLLNGAPFDRFEVFLDGDGDMFASPGLDQVTAENLQKATLFALGTLAIDTIGEGSGGIIFAVDLASIAVERTPEAPAPIPAPPALGSLMLGLAGLGVLGHLWRRRVPVT